MRERIADFWNRPWILSVGMGVLLGLSFPPFPFPLFTFVAFILLLRIVDLSDSARQSAFYAYLGFVIWNIIVTYWLMMATVAAGIAAILANSAVMTLPVMMQKKTAGWFERPWLVALLQACWWIAFEYLHHQWDLAWTWLSLGNAWANVPELVQYISATGYLGISFWVAVTAALAYRYLREREPGLKWAALGMLLLFPAVSLLQYGLRAPRPTGTLHTVVGQPNFDSYQEYGGHESAILAMDQLKEQSDSLIRPETDLVLWPENGIHPGLSSDTSTYSMATHIRWDLENYAESRDVTLVGGTTFYEYFEEGQAPPMAMRFGGGPYLAYNSALAFHAGGGFEIYRKHNLVPVVERIPFVKVLNALDVFGVVDWASLQGYGKGAEATLFEAGPTRISALVCYDSVFPGWVRQFVTGGAGVITVITNDGWWGDTGGHRQHFAYARLRAIEFQRWVLRSANNGISGVIAPDGSVAVKTGYWERDAFRYDVPVLEHMTLYARFGSWLPLLCLLLAGGSAGTVLVRRFRRPPPNR